MDEELLDKFIGPSTKHSHKITVQTVDGPQESELEHYHELPEDAPGHAHEATISIGWRMKREAI